MKKFPHRRRLWRLYPTFEDPMVCTSCRARPPALMEQGFGLGAEGDWKTAALLRNLESDGQYGLAGAPLHGRIAPTT